MENKKSKTIIIVLCILIAILLVTCSLMVINVVLDNSNSSISKNKTTQVVIQTTTEKKIETIDLDASVLGSDINNWLEKIPDLKYYEAGTVSLEYNCFKNDYITFCLFWDNRNICYCEIDFTAIPLEKIKFSSYGLDDSNTVDDVKSKFDNVVYEDDNSISVDLAQGRCLNYVFNKNKKITSVILSYPD